MGLASSVPANATAGQFPAIYQAPRSTTAADTYTDKKYVDDNFVPVSRFNDFFTNSYRNDVSNEVKEGSWAFAKAGATSNKLSDYVTKTLLPDEMKTQLENPNSTARTAFNTVFDVEYLKNIPETLASQEFGNAVNSRMTTAGYNPLTKYYVKEDGGGKLCHYSKSNNQREMCIDNTGKLYLRGLGINDTNPSQDQDVYSYILTQNNAYWIARGNLATPTQYVYDPTQGIVTSSSVGSSSISGSMTVGSPSTSGTTMITLVYTGTITLPTTGYLPAGTTGFRTTPRTVTLGSITYDTASFTINPLNSPVINTKTATATSTTTFSYNISVSMPSASVLGGAYRITVPYTVTA
jgi:hypothetical protein